MMRQPQHTVSLKARDQFASLLASTHPRCGRGDGHQHGLVIRVVWEYCIGVTRLFCVPSMDCVAQFRVSDVLGSVVGGVGEDDDEVVQWVGGPVTALRVINANHCNVVESAFHVDGSTLSFYLRNIWSNERLFLARDCELADKTALNAKWFVLLRATTRNLLIASTTAAVERGSQDIFPCAPIVEVPVPITDDHGDRALIKFFLNHWRHDEGILCIEKSGPKPGTTGDDVWTVELTRVDLAQTWTSKGLTVLDCTRFSLDVVQHVGDALVMLKRNGSRAFILSASHQSTRRQKQVIHAGSAVFVLPRPSSAQGDDWEVSLSQLNESLFCVATMSHYGLCPQSLAIWDVNHLTSYTAGPLRTIELSASVHEIFAEGGLLLSRGDNWGNCDIVVTEPSTGALILTLSGRTGQQPLALAFSVSTNNKSYY
ncbi:hypothetical protein Pelo_11171 [Pelomyxa schiedti]|nr:hypothetical protein Pelo_11171 [Pelomyxa schiedti]